MDDRQSRLNNLTQKEVNKIIDNYNKKKNKDNLDLSADDEDGYQDGHTYSELGLNGDFIIPDTLKKVEGALNLANTGVTKLPDNLTIGNYPNSHLDVFNCKKLNALPRGLKVDTVYAEDSGLIEIPDDIQTINLDLTYTKVKQLPLFKNFIKEIELEGCKYFKTLPIGFTAGTLVIKESKSFVSIPNNINLKRLEIAECIKFTSIGNNCSIDELVISYECPNFTTLPTDIKANNIHCIYDTAFRTQLVNKYKTKPKVMAAFKSMYPNVKQFSLFWK